MNVSCGKCSDGKSAAWSLFVILPISKAEKEMPDFFKIIYD
jgi:hypothetical protein